MGRIPPQPGIMPLLCDFSTLPDQDPAPLLTDNQDTSAKIHPASFGREPGHRKDPLRVEPSQHQAVQFTASSIPQALMETSDNGADFF